MKVEKFRDLTLISINKEQTLAISCDSCGCVGNKEMDVVKTDPEIAGFFTANVALAEIIAIGAKPVTIIDTLSVEMNDTGIGVIKGIKKALELVSNSDDIIITGSTEENFVSVQTGFGVTVIGVIDNNTWVRPKAVSGDNIVVVGMPKIGNEVLEDINNEINEILDLGILQKINDTNCIHDILPVGSKGILYEVNEMSKTSKLDYEIIDNKLDLNKSAGPATCAVLALSDDGYNELIKKVNKPITKIGVFK